MTSQPDYRKLTETSEAFYWAVSGAMTGIPQTVEPDDTPNPLWDDLYDVSRLAGVACDLIRKLADRAREDAK